MKKFIKYTFASMLGFILAVMVLFGVLFAIAAITFSALKETGEISVKQNSLLHIDFPYIIKEQSSDNPFENFNYMAFEPSSGLGLNEIIKNIKKAESDSNIKGIYLDLTSLDASYATIEEIRNSLIHFKKSKKFITAYSEIYTQKSYYLASVADKIFLNPEGLLEFSGLSYIIPFFKGTLEKLEIELEVIRVGQFKSAIEPYVLDKMSDANKLQIHSFINSIYQHFLSQVSVSRNINTAYLDSISSNLLIHNPADAITYKLADSLYYKDQVLASLRNDLGLGNNVEINMVSLKKYKRAVVKDQIKKYSSKKIAIVYAEGEITSGKSKPDEIGSETISKAIREARLDTTIKAIVLRINSPGGSALASDVIWREVVLAKQIKPVIASMGNLAASGGYYISCAADTIVAHPNTITGSIGVFGLLFNAQKFLNNKLGVTFDGVKTGKFSDIGNPTRPMTEVEKAIIQKEVNNIYEDFVKRVAEGRHMTTAEIDSIAQGRVWSGAEAKDIGLVDVLGGINIAIEIAADKAGIADNYRTVELPKPKEFQELLVENFLGEIKTQLLKYELGESFIYYKHLNTILHLNGIQARLPYEAEIR